MPGPGLVALMVLPLALGATLATFLRGQLVAAAPLRGLSVVPVVVLASLAAARLQGVVPLSDAALNRLLAGTILLATGAFLARNRHQPSALLRWGVRCTAGGAAGNALAMVVYGFMPVLAASANLGGGHLAIGDHPDPQYVAVDSTHLLAVVLGDVVPVPQLDAVVSLGDLLLVPGGTVLLAYFLALLMPARDHDAPRAPTGSAAPQRVSR
jgi:Family of unknown function (DUF5317)